ncbi:MAG: CotH kinase family protein [Bacteroidetes bacterium]|nr:CotH kinase family protein [Bacteroidota bacterium]
MKPMLCLLFLSTAFLSNAQSDGDILFNSDVLHEIRFESSPDFSLPMLIDLLNSSPIGEVPYIAGDVWIDGTLIPDVGVRIKGGISAYAPKRPLKIDFNKFVAGQEYDGMKKLNLQNADVDLAVQREAVVYDMFRSAGVKGPRTAFAKVYFGNTYQGVYIMVEQVDKNFLRNYFADDEGTLFKNKICQLEVDEGPDTFEPINDLQNIVNTLSGQAFRDALEIRLATDHFLLYFIVQHFINAVDGPMDVGCNYYIYHEPRSSLLYWLPWDYNLALYNGANYSILETNTHEALFNKMVADPVYRERYMQLACEMLDYVLNETYLYPRIDHNVQLIREALTSDPYFASISNFDLTVDQIKSLITARRIRFQDDLEQQNFDCQPLNTSVSFRDIVINELVASADSSGTITDPAGGHADWIELYNNTNADVSLHGFYLSNDRDFLKHWKFPEGIHISAGEYLAIWADQDVEESGLHADFKLKKDGGQLYLAYENLGIIDSVAYTSQTTNVALARVPNGTGNFVQQAPTFLENNNVSSSTLPIPEPLQIKVSPQPVSETLQVALHGTEGQVSLKLYNLDGQTVYSGTVINGRQSIDVQGMPTGLYFLHVHSNGVQMLKKIVIARR